jgi:hypothetical protein
VVAGEITYIFHQGQKMTNSSPFACNMHALSAQQRSQHHLLGETLQSSLLAVHELPNGYEFEFPLSPEFYGSLAQLTPLEHACCPFFVISIRLDHDKLFWQLTGSDSVKPFIRMEFEAWFYNN